jgi:hypothetical protein
MQLLFKETASVKLPNMLKPKKTMIRNNNNNLLVLTSIAEYHQPNPGKNKHAKNFEGKTLLDRLEIESIQMKLSEFNGFS